jgi:drug/metabolite transporter (DMT)-like permease
MVATILGAALLAEKLTLVFIVCFFAVLIGVLLVNWPIKIVAKSLPDTSS